MKKLKSLGSILSKQEMKKIVGGSYSYCWCTNSGCAYEGQGWYCYEGDQGGCAHLGLAVNTGYCPPPCGVACTYV